MFWDDKPVLVTGANGFIGSRLTELLVSEGARVSVFILGSSTPYYSNLEAVRDEINHVLGDVTDPASIENTLKPLKEESGVIVFHLASETHVGESWKKPYKTFHTNVNGTLNLIEYLMKVDVEKFMFAGTTEVHGTPVSELTSQYKREGEKIMFDELSPINPRSPYAVSKVAGDYMCRNFFEAYGFPAVVVRMSNCYGPRQNARYVTPTIITQALSREKIVLGALDTSRDFLYVGDGAQAYKLSVEKASPGEVYEFGYGEDISIGDWAENILQVGAEGGFWPKDRSVESTSERKRPGRSDIVRSCVDSSKAEKALGWKKKYSREDGIRESIDWYSRNKARWINQIDWK